MDARLAEEAQGRLLRVAGNRGPNVALGDAAGGRDAGAGKSGRFAALMRYESTLNIIEVTSRQSIADVMPTGNRKSPNGK